jgi:hypothetical protein
MSDVTVAPPGAAPSAAPSPSPSNEVAINPNPTAQPNPVGSQAPERPSSDGNRPRSTREAIQAAFDRANKTAPAERKPPSEAPKAAEARKGHNRPPEETPDEKFDLKKPPSEANKVEASPQPRDRGRFAPREQSRNADSMNSNSVGEQNSNVVQLPKHAPYRDPPLRMAEHAKRDWHATPETVRGEIGRMQDEFVKAYKFYKDDYEAFKPIKRFHQMAQQHGTTLDRALNNYTTMEAKLRADPLGGLDLIIHNLNLVDPQTNRRLDLRDISAAVLSQSPEQLKQLQMGNQQQAASHQIGALHQKIEGLESTLKQWQTQQQFTQVRSGVDQFADSHPRFDELGDLIEQELKLGFPIETAYRRAELLRPATHAAQTRNPSAQTRTTDRSISGAPADVTASNAASRRPKEASRSARDAVQNAMRRLNGSL